MRAAPLAEHKLEFGRYVRNASGRLLLARMAKASRRSGHELDALVIAVDERGSTPSGIAAGP
jgi:hypothetical protein